MIGARSGRASSSRESLLMRVYVYVCVRLCTMCAVFCEYIPRGTRCYLLVPREQEISA